MKQTRKRPAKPKADETIIHSDEGKLTYYERKILWMRDEGHLDDPENLLEEPQGDGATLKEVLAGYLKTVDQVNYDEWVQSNQNNSDKPCGGYYKVRRGHIWQTKPYRAFIERQELTPHQQDILLECWALALSLKAKDSNQTQVNTGPTSRSRLFADGVYMRHGLPTGSRRYALKEGSNVNDPASWIGEGTEAWLANGLPNPSENITNAFYLVPKLSIPEGIKVYEAHQLPAIFDFKVDSEVGAAADIHEAALNVERFETRISDPNFRVVVGRAMDLQRKHSILADMTGRADPSDPKSPSVSEAVIANLASADRLETWRTRGHEANRKKTEHFRDMAKAILQREKNRNLTPNKCAAMVIRENNLEVDQSAVAKAIKELFQKRPNLNEFRPRDEWLE